MFFEKMIEGIEYWENEICLMLLMKEWIIEIVLIKMMFLILSVVILYRILWKWVFEMLLLYW